MLPPDALATTVLPSAPLPRRPMCRAGANLRSCLSPPRTPSYGILDSLPMSASSSRSTSFSSGKSVRWEGEANGCAVTSYHPTWSKTEYDRTPLEPPAEHERMCVLPERNSRAIPSSMGCFGIDPSSPVDERFPQFPPIPPPIYSPTNFLDLPFAFADDESEDESTESMRIATPPLADEDVPVAPEQAGDAAVDEDHAWEECMQRRRMMFASMCGPKACQPEFEGYRSVSSTLADILRNMGCAEDGDCLTPVPEAADGSSDFTPADDCGFGVTLQRLNHLEGVDEEMPSLTSSSSSETDSQLESPQMGMVGGLVGSLGGMLAGIMVPKIMVDMDVDGPEGAQ